MTEFSLLTVMIAVAALAAFLWALVVERDIFHPAAFLAPMIILI